ncbi:MAG: DUF916 and DUF3324 domain-containing protein [Streptococcaceae bacterium]|nr:DUF916 and DUF3324 domain-containing protein [Streptococcaceae bacterium]
MKKLRNLIIVALSVLLLIGGVQSAKADEIAFSVDPNIPANQAEAGSGYFNLLMNPGQKQTVTVKLTNSTNKKVTVESSISSATTNINGLVEYSKNGLKPDSSLKYNIADYAKVPAETVLQPNTSTTVNIDVTMPSASFKGLIAGGITFKQKSSETDQKNNDQGFAIKNEYQYVVALLMRQDKGNLAPDLKLNTVEANQVNSRNVINANLQNPAMSYLNNMNVDAKVTGITDKSLSYSYANSAMQMAPNTNFNLPIPVSIMGAIQNGQFSKPIKAGRYHLDMTVYGQKDANGKYETTVNNKPVKYDYKWTFGKDFEVTAQQAKDLNANDLTVQKDNTWLYLLIAAGVLLLLALILFFLLLRRRKKNAKEDAKTASASTAEADELKAKLAEMEEKLKAAENNESPE